MRVEAVVRHLAFAILICGSITAFAHEIRPKHYLKLEFV